MPPPRPNPFPDPVIEPDLIDAWSACWPGLGAQGDGQGVMTALVAAYDEPQRKYHTRQHLRECLAWFERCRDLAERPAEVAMALWFHDAVYAPRAGDNEARSADWAARTLTAAGVAPEAVARVVAHIMATCHAALPQGPDQALLVDIDLSILGAARVRFDEYEQQVRAEYAWVPGFVYRRKRREVLAGFQARTPIYQTPRLHDALEHRAHENLAHSLRLLGG
ncbi:MAG: N-methyl-D-aspartate receptor NMDAR2C subunit [Rhodocyclaceae bacterium]